MKYAGIIYNDITAAPGLCVSFFTQGCPHHCPGCHNPETWDFNGGKEFTSDLIDKICDGLRAEHINRSLCIMGGEPLCKENIFLTSLLIREVRHRVPNTLIYIWTGYTYEELLSMPHDKIDYILYTADYLIDGPFKQSLRDVTLEMRGSSNQRIINLQEIETSKKI